MYTIFFDTCLPAKIKVHPFGGIHFWGCYILYVERVLVFQYIYQFYEIYIKKYCRVTTVQIIFFNRYCIKSRNTWYHKKCLSISLFCAKFLYKTTWVFLSLKKTCLILGNVNRTDTPLQKGAIWIRMKRWRKRKSFKRYS